MQFQNIEMKKYYLLKESSREETGLEQMSETTETADKSTSMGIIDCDVHPVPKNADEIKKHLKQPWRDRFTLKGRSFYLQPFQMNRADATPPDGGPAASDPDFLRKQLIEEYNVRNAILLHRAFCNPEPDPDYACAVAAAFNDWMAETWLDKYNYDGVFKGSITVAPQDPQQAAREIERWAGHPHYVQVLMDSGARQPFGQRCYWPIYEACQRHDLPLAIHVGTDGLGINALPSLGNPTHYIEWNTCFALGYMAHLISFLTEGVFDKFPGFRVVFVEGGVSWLAPILWRLDNNYKALRAEVPWMKRRPFEYLRDHIRFTSQPIESPDNPQHLLQIFEMMDAEHILMFASDYPHWDFDSPTHSFPKLPESLHRRIFYENAREFYNL